MKITLCGSTKFKEDFIAANVELSLQGHTVYSCASWGHSGDTLSDNEKLILHAVHMSKIANSDAILVINRNGYVGESTRREIYFAHALGKKVYLYFDESSNYEFLSPSKSLTGRPGSIKLA